MRVAAGMLPPSLLSGSAVGAGVSIGAKQASIKLLPAVLAWPAISLLSLAAALLFGLRAIRKSGSTDRTEALDGPGANETNALWWKQNWWKVVTALALLVGVGLFASIHAPIRTFIRLCWRIFSSPGTPITASPPVLSTISAPASSIRSPPHAKTRTSGLLLFSSAITAAA